MVKDSRIKMFKRIKQIALFSLLILTILGAVYFLNLNAIKQGNKGIFSGIQRLKDKVGPIGKTIENKPDNDIYLNKDKDVRKFPYPYNAMLALSSDIDFATLGNFKTYHQFLNTKKETSYGQGLGLDIGDSMWLFDGRVKKPGQSKEPEMTYYQGIDTNRKNNGDEIAGFIRSGWIDSIHTFGDFSTSDEKGSLFTRKLAIEGWKTLKDIGFSPEVWINHGNRANRQNFGAATHSSFMSYQEGDDPKSIYYHTDLTIENGIRYVWDSEGSSKFGEDYPLFKITLRDGRNVWGFSRYTSNVVNNKIDWTWTPKDFYRQFTQSNLDSIVNNKLYSIVAQHLGNSTQDLFTEKNLQALRLLKQYQEDKKILIAKTSRLLNYAVAGKYVRYNKVMKKGLTYIELTGINDPIFGLQTPVLDHYRGLTFYTDDPKNTIFLLYGNQISKDEIQINPKDETGKESMSIKWFAPDYTDYSGL